MARIPENTSGSSLFKHYNIRTFRRLGKASARAFVGDEPTAVVASSATVEEAVKGVEKQLAAQDAKRLEARQDGIPTPEEYGDAFAVLGPKVKKHHWTMLLSHFRAPEATATADELALAAGYPRYQTANLHYGALGRLVAEQLGFDPPIVKDGTKNWIAALADDRANAGGEAGEWRWTLRSEVMEYLRVRDQKNLAALAKVVAE